MPGSQVPVAVVGLAAVLPGARDAAEFWNNVVAGRDLITEVPPSHWAADDFYDPDPAAPDKTYCRRGAFLPDIDFDPLAHGLPPATLPALDPAQLIGLVAADELLADLDAGLAAPPDRDRVSIILGSSTLSRVGTMDARIQRPVWLRALREQGIDEPTAQAVCDRIAEQYVPWQEATFPGLLSNVVAGRIANRLDLHGTNCTVDAACASSLAAIAAAVNELALGQSDLVLTGGVDATNNPLMYVCFSKTPALSPTGDVRPFAEDADGTMLGEGVAMVALKRLDSALRAGDRVYAVIRGIGTSSDGRGGAIYAPMPQGQVRSLRRAYDAAGYGPETVELVEAHGTATKAGDAAEFEALRQVFGESGRPDSPWCALGTVKSQIGHTKAAAGAAGLVKAVLALHHRVLPPTIKVRRPNAALGLEGSPFYLNTQARPWTRPDDHPRRASVSSFGFGGANFHVALEESPHRTAPRYRVAASELVLLGAGSASELATRLRELADRPALPELARQTQRDFTSGSAAVLALVCRDEADLSGKLDRAEAVIERGSAGPPDGIHYSGAPADPGRIAFVFPGQGAQYVGMGADLAMAFPPAQDVWDVVATEHPGLAELVFPPPAFSDTDRAAQQRRLTETAMAQPALAAHSLSLLALLGAAGIEPACLAGHSLGELVALHAAGAMDAATLLRLARFRGEQMAPVNGTAGAMLAAAADPATVRAALDLDGPRVWLANLNGPRQTVVSGTADGIDTALARLTEDGITARRLAVSSAFHSPLMAPVTEPLRDFLDGLALSAPRIDVYGNTDACRYDRDPATVRARLTAHPTAPVRFHDQIEAMYAAGVRTFVEVGAGATLTGLIRQILEGRDHLAVSLDRPGRDGVTAWHEALAQLAVRGVPMDLSGLPGDWISTPPRPVRQAGPRMSVPIDGAGYHQPAPSHPLPPTPVPPPAALPEPTLLPESREPEPGPPSAFIHRETEPTWMGALAEVQRQTAEAHMHFQDVLAESHRAFLRMAETTFAALATPGTDVPAAPPLPAPAPPPPVAVTPPVVSIPAAPIVAPPVAVAPPVVSMPAAPVPAPPPPVEASDLSVGLLLEVVADKTGYPVEMINGAMDLEADLGIDSIKKVEIFAAVRQRVTAMPATDSPEMAQLFQLRTLDQIAHWAGGADAEPGPEPNGRRDPSGPGDPGPPAASALRRIRVTPVRAPACGLALAGLSVAPLVVVDGGSGLAAAVVEQLATHGITAEVSDDESVAPDAWGVVLLGGMAVPTDPRRAVWTHRAAFRIARTVAARMSDRGGVFVTVQDTGGSFGLTDPDPARAPLGGLAALARTAALEWPRAAVKAIDCQRGDRDPQAVAAAIVTELLTGGATLDVGLRADGTRWALDDVAAPLPAATPLITDDSVLVVTGGGRGVTAAALLTLAQARRPRLLLIGRTALTDEPATYAAAPDEAALTRVLAGELGGSPLQLAMRAREILAAREVRATLATLDRAGVTARYAALDVTDRSALDRELDRVRRDWGPVTGLVHGAGMVADKLIADKTDEMFDRVYATKVAGWHALLAAMSVDPLRLLCVFSSVAARFGNPGQCDYAMANETLNHLAYAESVQRPGCRVRSIGWGPWAGGMVTPALAAHFEQRGVPLIPLDAGAGAFLAELDAADDAVGIRIDAGEATPPRRSRVEVTVHARTHGYLTDHAPAGTPVLPLALALEWFGAAGGHPDLHDVRVRRRIDLPDLQGAGHRLTIEADGPDLRLCATDDQAHFLARLGPSDRSRTWPALEQSGGTEDVYDSPVLFHGPEFQALRRLDALTDAGADARVVGVRELGWPGGPWWTDPAAIDAALQAAVLWARHATGDATLPMGLELLRVHRAGPAPGPMRCLVRADSVASGQSRCDIALLDEDGLPRAELFGVDLIRRPDLPSAPRAETAATG